MKNIVNVLCACALVMGLAVLPACGGKANQGEAAQSNNQPSRVNSLNDSTVQFNQGNLPIAYVDLDSIVSVYEYAKDLESKYAKKVESDRKTLESSYLKFVKSQEEFQTKAQNNGFLSQSSAEQQYAELLEQERKLQEEGQRMELEQIQEQQKMLSDVYDAINTYIGEYNKIAGYDVILNKAATMYIYEGYDITKEIADGLNAKYAETKK